MRRWKLSEHKFENLKFYCKGSFFKKRKNCSKIQVLRLQGVITPLWFTNADNSRLNGPPTGCLVFIFSVRMNSSHSPGLCPAYKKTFPARISARLRYGMTYVHRVAWLSRQHKSRLNWKLKVSNTADNAGITQSQHVTPTRYRRMQEVNSLCVSK